MQRAIFLFAVISWGKNFIVKSGELLNKEITKRGMFPEDQSEIDFFTFQSETKLAGRFQDFDCFEARTN